MKKLLLLSIILFFNSNLVQAQVSPTITTNNQRINVVAAKSIYNGQPSLSVQLKDGKVPMNAPSDRVKLYSGQENSYKTFEMTQIAPGKFVTNEPVVLDESSFVLKVTGNRKVGDVIINFKSPQKLKDKENQNGKTAP